MKSTPESDNAGYVAAFYEIASMLGIPAQSASPSVVFETKIKPRLLALERLSAGQTPLGLAATLDEVMLQSDQYSAWMQVRHLAIRAHQICNLLRVSYPDIGELADDGCLHEAIHDLMRVDWPGKPPSDPVAHGGVG